MYCFCVRAFPSLFFVSSAVGYFITMNSGYAGRTELPDSLKALFRPVTMIVPDLQMICEIMLFSEGFNQARSLAKKMTVLYKLAQDQLSKQFHYDFALRALKSVLVMAGSLKRDTPKYSEELVIMHMRALWFERRGHRYRCRGLQTRDLQRPGWSFSLKPLQFPSQFSASLSEHIPAACIMIKRLVPDHFDHMHVN